MRRLIKHFLNTKAQRHKGTKSLTPQAKYREAIIAEGKYHEVNIAAGKISPQALPTQNVIEPV